MKKVFITLLIAVQSLWGEYYSVKDIGWGDTLSLRSSPSLDSKKVGELPYNATFITLERCVTSKNKKGPKKWCQIKYNTDFNVNTLYSGWVAEKYLQKSNNNIRQDMEFANEKYHVIRHSPSEVLNVRAGMGSNYKVVGELPYNADNIHILSCENSNKASKWCWVHYKGNPGGNRFGWVFSKYLQLNEQATSATKTKSAIPEQNSRSDQRQTVSEHLTILDEYNEIDVAHMLLSGNGEQCDFYFERDRDNAILNNCQHTYALFEGKMQQVFCTKNKQICGALTEVKNLLNDPVIPSRWSLTADKSIMCFTELDELNSKFHKLLHADKVNKFGDLLNSIQQLSDKCNDLDVYADFVDEEGCKYGVDNLRKSIKKSIDTPNLSIDKPCTGVYRMATAQAEFKSYNKRNQLFTYKIEFDDSDFSDYVREYSFVHDNIEDAKSWKKDKTLEKKILSCKKKIIRVMYDPEIGQFFDIDCEHEFEYNAASLKKECTNNISDSCYKYAEYLNVEKMITGDPLQYAKKAFILKKKNIGDNDIEMAQNYNQIGMIYIERSNYSKAMKLLQKALNIRENTLGNKHHKTAESYYSMGVYYSKTGDYPNALKYLNKALHIRQNIFGDNHVATAQSYSAIGDTYKEIGDYTRSLELHQKALTIRETILGKETLETTLSYNSVGEVYALMKDYSKAMNYFHKALKIRLELLYDLHPTMSILYTNIANIYKTMKDDVKSDKFFNRALFVKNFHDTKDAAFAEILNGIGSLYMRSKEYSYALDSFKRALTAQEGILGILHPATSTTYYNVGTSYYGMNNYAKAYEFAKKSFDVFITNRDNNFKIQTNKQKELYLKENSEKSQLLLETATLHSKSDSTKSKTIAQDVFNSWLNYKGAIFDSENTIAALYSNTKDQALKVKIDDLVKHKRYLAKLYQSLPKPTEKSSWSQDIKDTEEKIHILTSEITSEATRFKEQQGLKSINYKEISKKLKGNELYIDYARIGMHYYVFSLDNKEKIIFNQIDQKSSKEIDTLVQTFRKDVANILDDSTMHDEKLKQLTNSSKEKLSKLYELVLNKPFSNEIDDKTNLILSTDGALRLLPFEAMFDIRKNKYLIEEKELRYIPSGKELVRLYKYFETDKQDKTQDNTMLSKLYNYFDNKKHEKETVIFSNPDFNANIGKLALANKEDMAITPNTSRAGIIKSLFKMRFNALPGTKEEAISIKETLAGTTDLKEYSGEDANEVNLVKIKEPKILHIATHGFFINDDSVPNPMLKSGIALSGANTSAIKGKSDGIVTALKLSGLDLKGTDLVVLSACQTGVVDVNSTESVSGLSKAFIQAGAKDIVMSLWSVNDQATKALMSSFYKEMQTDSSYAKSLKEAKLQMIKKDMHPFFWAPFVVNGL